MWLPSCLVIATATANTPWQLIRHWRGLVLQQANMQNCSDTITLLLFKIISYFFMVFRKSSLRQNRKTKKLNMEVGARGVWAQAKKLPPLLKEAEAAGRRRRGREVRLIVGITRRD